MKSLRHPNIVKLVGVCWEDSFFACCLEFVENGSLEDWLRRTAGGRAYDASKQKKKRKRKKFEAKLDAHLVRCMNVFKGYDHNGEYDPSLHTDEDMKQLDSTISLMSEFAEDCRADGGSWNALQDEKGESFSHSIRAWCRYNSAINFGESLAILPQINASPSQVFAKYSEVENFGSEDLSTVETISQDYTTRLEYVLVPMPSPLSDREMLWRGVYTKMPDGSFVDVTYSVADDRKVVTASGGRLIINYMLWVKPAEGSGGKASEVWRMTRIAPNFGALMGSLLNSMVSKRSVSTTAKPLIALKEDTERMLGEYEPQLGEDASGNQSLTWQGQLLNIATQCALGVQYLHHEQYWAEEERGEDGVVEEAGYRQCIIHR